MDMFLILENKNSSSYPWIQILLINKINTIKKNQINKKNTLMGKCILKKNVLVP
jgi:hypothetical protein